MGDAHEHLALARWGDIDLDDFQGFACGKGDGGTAFHGRSSRGKAGRITPASVAPGQAGGRYGRMPVLSRHQVLAMKKSVNKKSRSRRRAARLRSAR
ncbi:hypothetical protein GCM10028794_19650 [Silanimonas algicola]